jgi:nucleotidyltransferase substrate binding protein (TIGR01987 family)
MSNGKLVLTSLDKALESLEAVLKLPKDEIVRDATIQRFEYTFELARKMIRRHLDWAGHTNPIDLTKNELYREAVKAGLIGDADAWFDYHQARNETSHTYELTTAEEVYEAAIKFAPDARALLTELKKHHG